MIKLAILLLCTIPTSAYYGDAHRANAIEIADIEKELHDYKAIIDDIEHDRVNKLFFENTPSSDFDKMVADRKTARELDRTIKEKTKSLQFFGNKIINHVVEAYGVRTNKPAATLVLGPFACNAIVWEPRYNSGERYHMSHTCDGKETLLTFKDDLGNYDAVTWPDGATWISPETFKQSPGEFASTLFHEATHFDQFTDVSKKMYTPIDREIEAYDAELNKAGVFRLTVEEIKGIQWRKDDSIRKLANRKSSNIKGQPGALAGVDDIVDTQGDMELTDIAQKARQKFSFEKAQKEMLASEEMQLKLRKMRSLVAWSYLKQAVKYACAEPDFYAKSCEKDTKIQVVCGVEIEKTDMEEYIKIDQAQGLLTGDDASIEDRSCLLSDKLNACELYLLNKILSAGDIVDKKQVGRWAVDYREKNPTFVDRLILFKNYCSTAFKIHKDDYEDFHVHHPGSRDDDHETRRSNDYEIEKAPEKPAPLPPVDKPHLQWYEKRAMKQLRGLAGGKQ